MIENEYRVIGPPGCLTGGSIVDIKFGENADKSESMICSLHDAVNMLEWCKETGDVMHIASRVGRHILWQPVLASKRSRSRTIEIEVAAGYRLRLTGDHELFLAKERRIAAANVECGDAIAIVTSDGRVGLSLVTMARDSETVEHVYDLTVGHPSGHGNYVANGIIVSNCGKTTYLADQVQKRVDAFCTRTKMMPIHCTDVLVASLTRAAAAEVHSRKINIPREQVGTLHSHCYRALGNPKMFSSAQAIKQWNEECGDIRLEMTGATADSDDSPDVGAFRLGDRLLAEYGVERSRLTPIDQMHSELREFATKYEGWKYINDYSDFHDLIERCHRDNVEPPGRPSVILSDETQDNDRAEFRLLRKWAKSVQKLIMVADPDQAIFEWRGADPGSFYAGEIPSGHTKVLEQSYRVPRKVHSAAMRMVSQIHDRVPVTYYPRAADGSVMLSPYSLRSECPQIVDEIERILTDSDETVMILSPCTYQLQAIRSHLRGRGIPYWNPYATGRGSFNPLHPSAGVSLTERLKAYLIPSTEVNGEAARLWTYGELDKFAQAMNASGWLQRGARQEIERRAGAWSGDEVDLEFLKRIVLPDQLGPLSDVTVDWFYRNAAAKHHGLLDYIRECIERRGFQQVDHPRVVVGTIHSVKGGQADHVYLSPDLSSSGWEMYGSNADPLYRLFYVGITRAAKHLKLLAPSGGMAIPWEGIA